MFLQEWARAMNMNVPLPIECSTADSKKSLTLRATELRIGSVAS